MAEEFDQIVIGAGVEGSATALDLVKRNYKVMLLEQFPLPHSRGSSHGQTRITRRAYPEEFYTLMMDHCTGAWRTLQQEAGETLVKEIGYLAIGPKNGKFLQDTMAAMSQHHAPYTCLSSADIRRKFPMLSYPPTMEAIWDPDGGVLMADKCLRAFQRLFVENGGCIKDNEKYQSLVPGEVIQIKTDKGSYRCKSVVFACGPWTNKVLAGLNISLPLEPVRITVCYWPEKDPGHHEPHQLPTFFEPDCCGGHAIYGLPSLEYPGHVKLCLHHGPQIDPDRRDAPDHQWTIDLVKPYVKSHFPHLQPQPSVVETCIYTNTPDYNFILDHHPKWRNIVIGAGFSGHGFKLAPAVGRVLADLATHSTTQWDISHFRIDRFDTKTTSKL